MQRQWELFMLHEVGHGFGERRPKTLTPLQPMTPPVPIAMEGAESYFVGVGRVNTPFVIVQTTESVPVDRVCRLKATTDTATARTLSRAGKYPAQRGPTLCLERVGGTGLARRDTWLTARASDKR